MPRDHRLKVVGLGLLGVVMHLELGPSFKASLYERVHSTPLYLVPRNATRAVFCAYNVALRLLTSVRV